VEVRQLLLVEETHLDSCHLPQLGKQAAQQVLQGGLGEVDALYADTRHPATAEGSEVVENDVESIVDAAVEDQLVRVADGGTELVLELLEESAVDDLDVLLQLLVLPAEDQLVLLPEFQLVTSQPSHAPERSQRGYAQRSPHPTEHVSAIKGLPYNISGQLKQILISRTDGHKLTITSLLAAILNPILAFLKNLNGKVIEPVHQHLLQPWKLKKQLRYFQGQQGKHVVEDDVSSLNADALAIILLGYVVYEQNVAERAN
jgi:hypothetical protein